MLRRRLKSWLGRALVEARVHRRFFQDRAVIVVFHRIDDGPPNPITCSRADFVAYCDLFAQHFDVVSIGELLRRMRAGESLSGCLTITFDDGYLDNAMIAAPELKLRGLPACFFVATDLIGSATVPWWDHEWGVASRWMDWDHVRGLHADGFDIGGHTLSHADLGKVVGADARREIFGCRERLERELGTAPRFFSYPYGRQHQMAEDNRALVREAGFECCMSAFGGSVRPGDDPFRILRSPISPWHLTPTQLTFELALDQ